MALTALLAALSVLAGKEPPHLTEAKALFAAVTDATTAYRHSQAEVTWLGSSEKAACVTDCSGFWNALIPHAYPQLTPERMKAWLGNDRPRAEDYWQALSDRRGFLVRSKVQDVAAGDFVAVKYEKGADNSGHTMIAMATPAPSAPSSPVVEGLSQWALAIIDVTSTPHGAGDSRGKRSGLGQGTVRLYSHADGTLAGYCWSLSTKSQFRPMSQRPVLIGALDLSSIPDYGARREPVRTCRLEAQRR